MKHLVLVSVIFFLGLLNFAQPEESRGPTITDLLKRLVESDVHRIYGWERIQGRNAGLPRMADMASFSGEENHVALIQMVEEQTDYRCIVSRDYFLVLPKEEELPAGGG
ncbi:hypothetical protein CfE428DRAFT_5008 [Chthoniobacter flavus Ellin428]|uniref:Uncharacterized protein n=1 Tax=Chthoniobacter flavus Ellin428 TaxID=497964 RepID=B4D7W8_9BACT|nr:hypothetical protein [Chthoniobacter flavus]EDY17491.1 hypothetical protein CfE428DRAFT_5008 [Chthoniobacter flavus Ellin428]TCO92287.1 hypothetical protein EV701_10656 [Chthoniobacter flavus]